MTNARERAGEGSREGDAHHRRGMPLIESGGVVGEGLNQHWETTLRCPDGMYIYQIVVIRINGVTAHAYTEQFSQRERIIDKFCAPATVQIGNYAHHPVVDHFTWLWAEEQDHAQSWERSEVDEMCWVHCRGVNQIMKPGGSEVIGRWHRTTPKGWGDKDRSVRQMVEEAVPEQERQQEYPMTAWIKKVSAAHDKDRIRVEYKTDVKQVENAGQFKESIENLLVVPYEAIGYRLSAREDATRHNDIWRKRWPECLVGMVIHSKSPDERVTSVNVDWKIVQECRRRGHKVRGLKEYKKEHQRKRPSGRGGSVKGGS